MLASRVVFAFLLSFTVVVLVTVDVVPGQDLPQHVATARIMLDYGSSALFQNTYELPARFQPYFTMYYVLTAIARVVGLDVAFRIMLAAYAIGVALGFDRLVAAVRPTRDDPRWASLLGIPLIWNPLAAMGFWAFMFAFVLLLFATAELLTWRRHGGRARAVRAIALAAAVAVVHVVAAGCLVLFVLVLAARERTVVGWGRAAGIAASTVLAFVIGASFGEHGLGAAWPDVADIMRTSFGLEFVNHLFGITWYDPPVTASYVAWSALGPFRFGGMAIVGAVLAGGWYLLRRPTRSAEQSDLVRSALFLLGIGCLVPWGLSRPSEVSFLNLRVIVFAVTLLLAFGAAGRVRNARGAIVASACAALLVGHLGYRLIAFDREAQPALQLMANVEPEHRMQVYAFASDSEHFGKVFRVSHWLPTYYVSHARGVSTQFWGRYTPHLPVAERNVGALPRAPTWSPERWRPEQFEAADYVMVQYATADDPRARRRASAGLRRALEARANRSLCRENWCVYRMSGG